MIMSVTNAAPDAVRLPFAGRFAGRRAVVTGGASGLGKVVARRIVAEGGRVSLWDVDPDALSRTSEEFGGCDVRTVDVSDEHSVADAATTTLQALDGVDILVCSAAITGETAPVHKLSTDIWRRVFEINTHGPFYCSRALLPAMIERGYGRIVNVASVAGKEGNPYGAGYSASKAALIGFTKSLAKEVATKGVIANAIAPGAFWTPFFEQLPEKTIDFMKSKIPMSRIGNVEEVAAMICFMASEECSFTTGGVFDTSGGRATY